MSPETPKARGESVALILYRRQMHAILASGAPTVIVAGRGMGKTSVLLWLAEQSGGHYVEGRGFETARRSLDEAAAKLDAEELTEVLIDDLDYLLDEERNSEADVKEALERIDYLRSELAQRQGRLIVASASPVSRFLRTFASRLWSDIEDRFQRVVLFPWSIGWAEAVRSATLAQCPRKGEQYAPAVVETTGGHPALVSAAFESLQDAEDNPPTGIDWSAYLSTTLGRAALSPIEKALNSLQTSNHSTDQEALSYLTLLVGGHDNAEGPKPSPQVVRALELSGLAYSDPLTGRCVVPGTIIRRYLDGELLAVPQTQPEISVTLVGGGDDEGVLMVGEPPERQIPLSKGPWRLVQTLFAAKGETVALEDLVKTLDLDSVKPLYSIIQRLDQKAKEARVERIIENVRGQGYRLSRALRWKT
jgi:hypothetical protein